MPERVVVRAPATVANLGPGFDILGMAISWFDQITVERIDAGLEITAAGVGAEKIKRDDSSYIAQGVRWALGEPDAPLRIHKLSSVAFGRGFGSSAISIVGGLVAGRALGATPHADEDLLARATEIEGHPDNVAPCLLGGVTVSAAGRVIRLDPPAQVRALVCVAPTRLKTTAARGVLPDSYPRADAVATSARAALLATGLATGDLDVLFDATEDVLHQPYRFELMPDTGDLVRALRTKGIAAYLSGGGPSAGALVAADRADEIARIASDLAPEGWEVRVEDLAPSGAEVVDGR